MVRFAAGTHALAICDRCGGKVRYHELRKETGTGFMVCEDCRDEPTGRVVTRFDAVVLRNPRPEVPLVETGDLLPGIDQPPSPTPPAAPVIGFADDDSEIPDE